jgi:hypothetical protein
MILRTLILRGRQKSPAVLVPVAMMLITLGLGFMVAGVVWPRSALPVAHLGTAWGDFFRGFLFGIAIVMEVGGVVMAVAAATRAKKL